MFEWVLNTSLFLKIFDDHFTKTVTQNKVNRVTVLRKMRQNSGKASNVECLQNRAQSSEIQKNFFYTNSVCNLHLEVEFSFKIQL